MYYSFDAEKDAELKKRRGIGFMDVSKLFERKHLIALKTDDPEQYFAIGWVKNKLWTVVFEDSEDDLGALRWLVTFWPSTTWEKKLYEEEIEK